VTDRRLATCPYCGAVGTVKSKKRTNRQHRKFGFGWVILTICTLGLAIPLWMLTHPVGKASGTDRWNKCTACGTTW
jgi:uncharacterized Zn finger protein